MKELLDQVKEKGLHRKRLCYEDLDVKYNFSSNDYLSLGKDKSLSRAFQEGFSRYPAGSSASTAVSGYFSIHRELESAFSSFLKLDQGLLFSSGYAANLAVVALLKKLDYRLVIDKLIHASVYDGIALSKPEYCRFMHNDPASLAEKLASPHTHNIVLVEAVYSTSGQIGKLSSFKTICQKASTLMLVDEAHSFGLYGPDGAGWTAETGLMQDEVPLRIIPFGKTLAAQGAIVVGDAAWIDALFQFGRSAIYSTAMSPAMAFGVLKSLERLIQSNEKRQRLFEVIAYFNKKIKQSSHVWQQSETAIQQLKLGCPHKATRFSALLLEKGFLCLAMRRPTVSQTDTGLRVILNADHAPDAIDALFLALETAEEQWCKSI